MGKHQAAGDEPAASAAGGLDAFVRVGHDLRNPLAPIRTAVQLLRMLQGDPTRSKDLLDLIERQVGHLVRLIDRLTEYGELQTRGGERPNEAVDLALAIDQAVGNCSAVIGNAGHRLNLSLPERNVTLVGNPTQVAQAVSHVIENAAKFQASGGSIDITLLREQDQAVVRIRDHGFGMSPATLAGLFQPFARGTVASPHMPTGLGLGLALSRAIVERHGGDIAGASAGEGHGSEFAIRLPVSG